MATYIETPNKVCEICSKVFSRNPRFGLERWEKRRFCSKACRAFQIFPSESRLRMTQALALNRSNRKGKKPWNWKEDRSLVKIGDRSLHDPRYKQWHKEVKSRDGWRCKIGNQVCSGRLEAHHILSWSKFPELRYEVKNGITLCKFHHPRRRDEESRLSPYFQRLIEI